MSNFLFVVFSEPRRERLGAWLRHHNVPESEVHWAQTPLGGVLVVARNASEGVRGRSYFRGTAVSSDGGSIAYGADAWRTVRSWEYDSSDAGGEFISAEWGRSAVVVHRDLFGSVPLLMTQSEGFVALSDSLLVLHDLRRALGEPTSLNLEVAFARSRTLAICVQQMSKHTLIEQVDFVLPGRSVRICTDPSGSLSGAVEGATMATRVLSADAEYDATIRRAVGQIAGLMRAATEIPDHTALLSLTGGFDSRLLLAAGRRVGGLERLAIETHNHTPANVEDFEAAGALAATFGFQLNDLDRVDFGEPVSFGGTPASVWASSHLGVYDRVVPTTAAQRKPRAIPINGVGAGAAKGAYGWRNSREMDQYYSVERIDRSARAALRREAFKSQFEAGVLDAGAHPDWADASEFHYLAFRNGLHSGAHLSLTMTGLRPLAMMPLAQLGHARTDRDGTGFERRRTAEFDRARTLIPDMLALMDPELASAPYSEPSKDLLAHAAVERVEARGRPLADDEIVSVEVLGSPSDAIGGPSVLGLSIAAARGYGIESDAQTLLELARTWIDGIDDDDLRVIYRELLQLAETDLIREGLRPADASSALAKVLSLGLWS